MTTTELEGNLTADKVTPVGTIVRDWFEDGIRIIIMRGPTSFNTYLGVPLDHPLAGFPYDDLPIECHGGLTYSAEGHKTEKIEWPEGFWWYGYDYGHAGDKFAFADVPRGLLHDHELGERAWTIDEIKKDAWGAIYSMKQLMKLAERIHDGKR